MWRTYRRMSKIVIHNNTVYLCGQVAKDSDAGIKEQTQTMLDKVDDLLKQAGSDCKHILSATLYIKEMKDFAEMNEVYGSFFAKPFPARAAFEVAQLPKNGKVEIMVTAIK